MYNAHRAHVRKGWEGVVQGKEGNEAFVCLRQSLCLGKLKEMREDRVNTELG